MNDITKLVEWNDKLMGLPSGVLVFLGCIAVGYLLRSIKRFPNDGIPLTVVLIGCILFMLVAPDQIGVTRRIWLTKNFLFGLIIGLSSWMIHKIVLSKVEDRLELIGKLPESLRTKTGNTDMYVKPPIEPKSEDRSASRLP